MSFFSSVGKALRIAAGTAIGAAVPVIGPAIGGAIAQSAVKRTAVPTIQPASFSSNALVPTAFPGGAPIQLPSVSARTPLPDPLFGPMPGDPLAAYRGSPPGPGYHLDKKTRTRWVKNRRMNPMNHRAAMRAIRRVKAARKMLQKIERQLPKQRTSRSVRHVPTRYAHRSD